MPIDKLFYEATDPDILAEVHQFMEKFPDTVKTTSSWKRSFIEGDVGYAISYYSYGVEVPRLPEVCNAWLGMDWYEEMYVYCRDLHILENRAMIAMYLGFGIVSDSGSIGQVQRMIPDLFKLFPARFSKWASNYERKPQLNWALNNTVSELKNNPVPMNELNNLLLIGSLINENNLDDNVNQIHVEEIGVDDPL